VELFLAPTTIWAPLVALATIGASLLLPQRPVIAGAALAAMQWTLTLAHVTEGGPALLAPYFIAVYSLGRHASGWPAIAVAAAFPASAIVEVAGAADEPPLIATLVFAVGLTAGIFAYGYVVRRRARMAARSRVAASRLQSTDAATVAARVVADERARLGGQALGLLRNAVGGMRADAAAARRDLDARRIDAIAERGRQAVTELRWLLGLLRTAPPAAACEIPQRRARWIPNVCVGVALLVLGVLEVWSSETGRSSLVAWVVAVGLPICTVGRGRWMGFALAAAVALLCAAAIGGVPFIVAAGLCVVLLAWSAGVTGGPLTWALFGATAVVAIVWVALDDPANVPIGLGVLGLATFAGHEWSMHDRDDRAAKARTDALRAGLDARLDDARRDERLRLARDLHDVASHAVGVMVLQASVVRSLRESDPAAARQALSVIDTTAEQALAELAVMFHLLDSGAIGAPGLAGVAPEPLSMMAERLRRTGLLIELDVEPVPRELEGTVYRLIQESLTNVLKHSDALHVRIRVASTDAALSVRVMDDGHPTDDHGGTDGPVAGFGLAGMAERIRVLDGEFRAGPDDHGFTVEATMPARRAVRS
jgi:signal transduction histidine kinase